MVESLTTLLNKTVKNLLQDSKYDEVITKTTEALNEYPKSAGLYIARSTAYQRSGAYGKSFKDAEKAIVAAHASGNREKIGTGQLRRAIALYFLNRFDDALYSLTSAEKYIPEEKTITIWKSKIVLKLGSDKYDEDLVTIQEIPTGVKLPEPTPSVKKSDDDKAKEEKAETPSAPSSSSSSSSKTSSAPSTGAESKNSLAEPAEPPTPNVDNIRHDWFQTTDAIDVSLFIKNTPKDKVKVEFSPTSASVSFPMPTGSEFVYDFDPFYAEIDPKKSSFKVYTTKIEINLVKAETTKWPKLLGDENSSAAADESVKLTSEEAQKGLGKPVGSGSFAYPTSSKKGPINWDTIASSEVKSIEETERENDPNAFFKLLYENADPDTQRAILKSYTESNGTALSTNWDEVSKGKVECSPPDGMEAKSWLEKPH